MSTLISFFSDLLLFTGGVIVSIFWIIIVLVILVEILDLIKKVVEGSEGQL